MGRIPQGKGKVDIRLNSAGKLNFGLFSGFLQPLEGELVLPKINPLFLFKFIGQEVNDALVKVLAAQKSIAIGGFDFKDAIADFKNRDIKGTSS